MIGIEHSTVSTFAGTSTVLPAPVTLLAPPAMPLPELRLGCGRCIAPRAVFCSGPMAGGALVALSDDALEKGTGTKPRSGTARYETCGTGC